MIRYLYSTAVRSQPGHLPLDDLLHLGLLVPIDLLALLLLQLLLLFQLLLFFAQQHGIQIERHLLRVGPFEDVWLQLLHVLVVGADLLVHDAVDHVHQVPLSLVLVVVELDGVEVDLVVDL